MELMLQDAWEGRWSQGNRWAPKYRMSTGPRWRGDARDATKKLHVKGWAGKTQNDSQKHGGNKKRRPWWTRTCFVMRDNQGVSRPVDQRGEDKIGRRRNRSDGGNCSQRSQRHAENKMKGNPPGPPESIGGSHMARLRAGKHIVAFRVFLYDTSVASIAKLILCCFAANL